MDRADKGSPAGAHGGARAQPGPLDRLLAAGLQVGVGLAPGVARPVSLPTRAILRRLVGGRSR